MSGNRIDSRLRDWVKKYREVRDRGALPPDCEHPLCQSGIYCEEPDE